ncbi:hypothetical protein B0H21DRAFT_839215 [Amylocystis lapponica]|nr:hypothetical protein B0H21DRAFT_839215 [Amylocystis lapponica]
MAYNREWDRGKYPTGSNDASWQHPTPRANVHPRDDDYYAEGKRRKFNNGVRQLATSTLFFGSLDCRLQSYDTTHAYDQGYDDSAYDGGHMQAQGRLNDYGQDYTPDDRQKGGGHVKKRLVPSEPSPHVIFLGLDPDFTEADLQAYLTSHGCSIETVTIIRDRSTGVSKGFGFAQFSSTEHARAFVDPLFPFIQVPPPASHGATASAAFYKALEAGNMAPQGGRRVKIDYSQSASPGERRARVPQHTNDGTRDIGNTQASVLLFRGLDPLSGPQAIAQALKTSSGPNKEGATGMKRIILIKDKVTLASWGFAFVEFVDIPSASAVLGSTMSPQIHPSGFRISDRPVAASFAHPYSFQPLPDYSLRDEACLMSSTGLGGIEGTWVRYWDEASTAAVLEFKVEEPLQPVAAPIKEKKDKKRTKGCLVYNTSFRLGYLPPVPDTVMLANEEPTAEPSTLPVSDKPVTLNFKGGLTSKLATSSSGNVGAAKKSAPLSLAFSMEELPPTGEEDQNEDLKGAAEDPKVAAAKRVAPLIASKKTANNINKWNQVQEVLKDDTDTPVPVAQTPALVAPDIATKAKSTTPVPEGEFEFSDTTAMTCLLCARQFKSLDQLKRHNKESDLHKKNRKDTSLRDLARQKAEAARSKTEQPKYRDRASERRVMHNQPDVPLPSEVGKAGGKRRHAEGPPPPPSPPPMPVNPGQDENNVGNKLLKMMGWKEGTGLGTDGEGRVDPIQTAIYAQGVGLGASKGKDIGKYAEGYSGYVHMAQDAARERYGS